MALRSSLWKVHTYTLLFFFLFLALFPPSLIFILIPTYFLRLIVSLCRPIFRPDLGSMIHTRSSVIATDNPSCPNPMWNLCVWITLKGSLNFTHFTETFLNDVVLKKSERGDKFLHPEFQQYYSTWLSFLFWKWEEAFDIKQHMKPYCPPSQVTTDQELRKIIQELTAAPFPEDSSPWEFLYIPNYSENNEDVTTDPKSVIIFRVHHGFCDGYAILALLLQHLNKVDFDQGRVAKPAKIRISEPWWSRKFLSFVTALYSFFQLLVESVDSNEWHLPQDKLSRPFNTAFSPSLCLNTIKQIKNEKQVSFTTVIMAAVTGGLRRMMIQRGVKNIPSKLTTAVAVPMPGHPLKMRNHFIFSFISLPVGISDPAQRLAKMQKNYEQLKSSRVPLFSFIMVPLIGGLCTWMIKWFSTNYFSTVLTSNFPGPGEPVNFIAGGGNNLILDINFSAGMGVGSVGIGFCMMSYNNKMRIISSADKSILSCDEDVEELNAKIMEELEDLKSLDWDIA